MQIQEEGDSSETPVSPTGSSARSRVGSYKASLQPVGRRSRQTSTTESNPANADTNHQMPPSSSSTSSSPTAPSSALSGKVVGHTTVNLPNSAAFWFSWLHILKIKVMLFYTVELELQNKKN